MALTRDKLFWTAFSDHSARTVEAAKVLIEMLEHLDRRESLAAKIKELEHAGDQITHDCVQALHQTWITPLDREEIHSLITKLDDVLDFLEAAGERIALYEIREVRPEAIELAQLTVAACTDIQKAVAMLTDLNDPKPLLDLCVSINKHEHDADVVYRRALARLFNNDNPPLEVMKWRDILDALETATDRAEDVANIIEGIVLEHA
jgi:predicted phosphate transport protein (TIGR00153 family)